MTKKEHLDLQQLKKDPSIIITKADKGNIATVLDKEWYDNKINQMLDDEEIYKRLKTSPTATTTKEVNKFINNLLESNRTTKEASFRLKITDATTPRLYGLPKLHKENIPLRPTVSFTDLLTYGLAKELSVLLKPLIGKSKYHVRNSSDFASPITHEILQTDEIMVSFDVVSLFTKVPIQLPLNIAKQRLQSDPNLSQRTGMSTSGLIKGLEICLNSTNFTFRGKHYKQVFGTAMGSPVSSVVANLVMIMKRSKLSEFLTHLNKIENSIQFTMEKEKEGCLPFLDLLVKRSPSGHLLSAVYRKPAHSYRYLNFRSEHPMQHK